MATTAALPNLSDCNPPRGRFYSGLAGLVEDSGPAGARRRTLGLIDAIAVRLQEIAAERATAAGIGASALQIMILITLGGQDGVLRASAIQRAMGITAGGVTRRLDNMEAAGLVERLPDPNDGRAWLVRMTDKGREVLAGPMESNFERNARMESGFTAAEWDMLQDLLGRMFALLG
jgi:DNA-binding MarR family transcriptional regulator